VRGWSHSAGLPHFNHPSHMYLSPPPTPPTHTPQNTHTLTPLSQSPPQGPTRRPVLQPRVELADGVLRRGERRLPLWRADRTGRCWQAWRAGSLVGGRFRALRLSKGLHCLLVGVAVLSWASAVPHLIVSPPLPIKQSPPQPLDHHSHHNPPQMDDEGQPKSWMNISFTAWGHGNGGCFWGGA